ncbi:hypothetical protein ACTWPT_27900 [Nonomuraea sp. 3N208]|uniref:hypothetical protein n=1 Tax=Nonomuraea sp. 3N208 TaxID=3457421 RepID=UPI003FD54C46
MGALFQAGFDELGTWRALGAVNGPVFGSLLLSTGGFTGDPMAHAGERNVSAYIREIDPVRRMAAQEEIFFISSFCAWLTRVALTVRMSASI